MPSREARLSAIGMRVFTALAWRPFYPISYQRYTMSRVAPRFMPTPKDVERQKVTLDGIKAEWLIPRGADETRVLLYFHGGAFVVGSIDSHWKMAARIASIAGCGALVVDYRLAPEHPFPAALDDAAGAYKWLIEAGYDPGKIVIAGDSAGGCLTAAVLIALRDSGQPMPAGAMMLSPAVDLAMTGETMKTLAKVDPMIKKSWGDKCINMYLRTTDPKNPVASPLYADLRDLPPILIQVGTREILLDDARRFAERAREFGVDVELEVWDGMFHVWQYQCPITPESRDAVKNLGKFCREKTGA